MSLVTAPKKVKTVYTDSELAILMTKPNIKKCTFVDYRNWFIVTLLYGTGIRVKTAVNIQIKDVDLESKILILRRTKNNKQQNFYISDKMAIILYDYLHIRKGKDEDYLICNYYGGKLHENGLYQAVHDYNIRHGIMKTSPHLFRHTFARKVIKRGARLNDLQELLGHYDVTMSEEYLDEFSPDLQNNFQKFDPLNDIYQTKSAIAIDKRKAN